LEKLKSKIERVIDANFNRAREGLRVVEDIARFVVDDKEISKSIKDVRSALTSIQKESKMSINFRDTQNDVGTQLNTKEEKSRNSVEDIVLANAKRAQESLRVLEEVFKIKDKEKSSECKALRYRSYTIEQTVLDRLKKVE
jgi:hypothetical protein